MYICKLLQTNIKSESLFKILLCKLCKKLHLANYDITISPLPIRNTLKFRWEFTAKNMKLYTVLNFTSISAAEKRPLSHKTPQSFHRPRYCGVQTLPLKMHYRGEKLGKEWSDFDPQRRGSYCWGSGLWCKVSSKLSENCDRRRGETDRQKDTDGSDFREAYTIPTDSVPTDAIPTIQSGWPSTSLARLGICRNSRNLQKTARIGSRHRMHRNAALIEAPRWPRGVESGEGIPVVWGAPSSGKVTTYVPPTHYCTAPDFRHLVRHLSNRYCPWAYSTAVSHPTSRLWTVGIASVGTESVGIAWCTRDFIICPMLWDR